MRAKFFVYPFGVAGDLTAIPDPTQIGGSVSFQSGWGFNYQRQIGVDPLALPIDRATMNYLMQAITANIQAWQSFPYPEWITTVNNDGVAFAYDYGAIVRYSATGNPPFVTYISTLPGVGTNTSVPGADANWRILDQDYLFQPAGIPTGAINGINTSFVLPQVPVGSITIFINRMYAILGTDYTLATALGVTTITTLGAPLNGLDSIAFTEYRY